MTAKHALICGAAAIIVGNQARIIAGQNNASDLMLNAAQFFGAAVGVYLASKAV